MLSRKDLLVVGSVLSANTLLIMHRDIFKVCPRYGLGAVLVISSALHLMMRYNAIEGEDQKHTYNLMLRASAGVIVNVASHYLAATGIFSPTIVSCITSDAFSVIAPHCLADCMEGGLKNIGFAMLIKRSVLYYLSDLCLRYIVDPYITGPLLGKVAPIFLTNETIDYIKSLYNEHGGRIVGLSNGLL